MIRSTVFVALLASITVDYGRAAPFAAAAEEAGVQSVVYAEETGRFLALRASGKVSANADMSKHTKVYEHYFSISLLINTAPWCYFRSKYNYSITLIELGALLCNVVFSIEVCHKIFNNDSSLLPFQDHLKQTCSFTTSLTAPYDSSQETLMKTVTSHSRMEISELGNKRTRAVYSRLLGMTRGTVRSVYAHSWYQTAILGFLVQIVNLLATPPLT